MEFKEKMIMYIISIQGNYTAAQYTVITVFISTNTEICCSLVTKNNSVNMRSGFNSGDVDGEADEPRPSAS